jgi:GMP synthase (glutamine-hydrolysing)
MLRLHYLQHEQSEGPGYILSSAAHRGWAVTRSLLYENPPLPSVTGFDLLVIMGGSMNVYETDKYPWLTEEKQFIANAIASGTRVLGICLGAQLIADTLGARVTKNRHQEIGWFPIHMIDTEQQQAALRGLPAQPTVLHWHGDTFAIPDGATRFSESKGCENQGFVYDKRVIALQYHLECDQDSMEQMMSTFDDRENPGPFVQKKEIIKTLGRQHIPEANRIMDLLLDNLSA